jgi:hypothetical protein
MVSRVPVVLIAATAACYAPAPVPQTALGCFAVNPIGWSRAAGRVTGFDTLPRSLALDSSFVADGGHRVILARTWQDQPPNINTASWRNEISEWRRLDDSIIFIRARSAFHTLGADSIVITWRGWGGSLTAFLAQTGTGYRGLAQLEPRPLAAGVARITVELTKTACDTR